LAEEFTDDEGYAETCKVFALIIPALPTGRTPPGIAFVGPNPPRILLSKIIEFNSS